MNGRTSNGLFSFQPASNEMTGYEDLPRFQREMERALGPVRAHLGAFQALSSALGSPLDELVRLQERLTLPRIHIESLNTVRDAMGPTADLSAFKELARNGALAQFRDSTRQLTELTSALGPARDITRAMRQFTESLVRPEALLVGKYLRGADANLATLPQREFQAFALRQVNAAQAAQPVARHNRLKIVESAAGLLGDVGSGIGIAALMRASVDEPMQLPEAVDTYAGIEADVDAIDLADPSVDGHELVESSNSAAIARLGSRITQLVYDMNRGAEQSGKDAVFKPTTKVMYACATIPVRVAGSDDTFATVVDQLYFLIYEGSGDAARLVTDNKSPVYEPLWMLKHLRLAFRHDVDHGDARKAREKMKSVGSAYTNLIGSPSPKRASDWSRAQLALYQELVLMLESAWNEM